MKKILIFLSLLLIGAGCTAQHGENHDTKTNSANNYEIILTSAYNPLEKGLEAKKSQQISFVITRPDKSIVTEFDTVHEKNMHVIITKLDLSTFAHIHPTFNPMIGQFEFSAVFEEQGVYRMFTDFTPTGETNVVSTYDLLVGGLGAGTNKPLVKNNSPFDAIDGYIVRYQMPTEIKTGEMFGYVLQIVKDGVPVVTEPYLGAGGHSIILREGSLDYLHAHAETNKLAFSTTFSSAGKYAIYTQFQINGNVYTSRHVIEVKQGKK